MIIDDCYAKAKSILEEHMDVLHACAKLLMEKERIDRAEFEALFDKKEDAADVSDTDEVEISEGVDVTD